MNVRFPKHIALTKNNCTLNIVVFTFYLIPCFFIFRFKDKKICNYSNPRNGEPYFCTSPPFGVCSKIISISFPDFGFEKPFDVISQLKSRFVRNQTIFGSGFVFQVMPQNENNEQKQEKLIKNKLTSSNLRPNGYVYNGQWVSLTHNYQPRSLNDFKKCFSNKAVYFLGDSTMRQFFLLMVEPLELNVTTSTPDSYFHILRTGRNDKLNISLYYRTHGLPFRLQGPPVICPYITDVIDAMETGGSDVLIIISLGLHYLKYHPSFFIHRLLGIKQAILRHLEKHPNTKFIIKGLNISLNSHYPFEWLVLRYSFLLKEILKLEKIIFIDLWDMTTVWPIAYYHPVEKILVEQANLMFSYFCT